MSECSKPPLKLGITCAQVHHKLRIEVHELIRPQNIENHCMNIEVSDLRITLFTLIYLTSCPQLSFFPMMYM